MKRVYAKNPAEIIVMDNPAPKKNMKKDPRRVAAGKKAWKTRQQTNKSKKGTRMNPKKVASTGKKLLGKYGLVAVGTLGAVRITDLVIQKIGQNLPAAVRNYAPIAIPLVGGVLIATKANNKNEVAQGVAGGMVYAAVAGAINRFMPKAVTGDGLADAIGYSNKSMLSDGYLAVAPDGTVMDQFGNPYGTAVIQKQAETPSAMLADASEDSFEFASYSEEMETF